MHKTQPKVRETPILEKIYEHWNGDSIAKMLTPDQMLSNHSTLEKYRHEPRKMVTVERTSESIVKKVASSFKDFRFF